MSFRHGGYNHAALLALLATSAAIHPDQLYERRMNLESEAAPPPEVVYARLTKTEKKRDRKNRQRARLTQSSGEEKP